MQTNNFWLEIFFKIFEPFWIFCRNLWHGAQTSIFVSTVKIPEEMIFLIFFLYFFSDFERIFFRLSAKKLQEVSKLPSTCAEEQFVAWIFFLYFESFWTFWRNLWHGSQNSIYVFRVKIAEELIFLFFFSEFFSEFERKTFRLSAKELQEIVKTTFRVCGWTNFGLGFFLKCFEPFWIFCRNLWHGSQNSIYVSRVKIAEEMVFFCFSFQNFFSNFEQKFFRPLAKKLQEVDKTTLCVFRRTIFGLKFFSKVLSRFGFSSENLAWFSNFYLRVQRKNSGRNNFFILLFRFFSEFGQNFFSDFWPKNVKKLSKLTSVFADEQFLAWNFFQKFWTVLDFLQKPLAWCSNFYLRVHSKNSGRNDFFNLLFIIFFGFWAEIFQTFGQKTSRSFQNYLLRV